MREEITAALKQATLDQDRRRMNTLRLILAAIGDRDIAARGEGREPVSDQEMLELLARMIKQRQESARLYEEGNRLDLAGQEREEIEIIRAFLPRQFSDSEVQEACAEAIRDTGAQGLRDVGRCMAELKARYPGQMDFGAASRIVKAHLG